MIVPWHTDQMWFQKNSGDQISDVVITYSHPSSHRQQRVCVHHGVIAYTCPVWGVTWSVSLTFSLKSQCFFVFHLFWFCLNSFYRYEKVWKDSKWPFFYFSLMYMEIVPLFFQAVTVSFDCIFWHVVLTSPLARHLVNSMPRVQSKHRKSVPQETANNATTRQFPSAPFAWGNINISHIQPPCAINYKP